MTPGGAVDYRLPVMRMSQYYLSFAVLLVPALIATFATGVLHDGSQVHLAFGLFTAIFCVAQNTLLILFMIVTGRVLKAAVAARSLPREFLEELNQFFAKKRAYPVALLASTLAVATAVLGYGRFIGVPSTVHMLLGLVTVLFNFGALRFGFASLRANQSLIDRAAATLDEIDRASPPDESVADEGGPDWAFGYTTRWLVFSLSAWLPYLYWGGVVWHGEFLEVSPLFPLATAAASALALWNAFRPPPETPRSDGDEGLKDPATPERDPAQRPGQATR